MRQIFRNHRARTGKDELGSREENSVLAEDIEIPIRLDGPNNGYALLAFGNHIDPSPLTLLIADDSNGQHYPIGTMERASQFVLFPPREIAARHPASCFDTASAAKSKCPSQQTFWIH